ncbi:hypothetical protein LTR66_001526 [Elasticomyces elasticus]|nr:hypothetical protein LTR50_004365 [Elasticomyces elasticus]KAK4999425.1 hypothetical protein LTR66_001526 [Elasticomyces elasticus]
MSTYEQRRLENIRRNQTLIKELGISKRETAESTRKPPLKKRKLSPLSVRPTRVSSRIASAPTRPAYNEDISLDTERPAARKKQKSGSVTVAKVEPEETLHTRGGARSEDELAAIRAGWTSWKPTEAQPTRDANGTFHFASHLTFTPNKSPAEVLREGAFGGSYFRPLRSRHLGITVEDDWHELPEAWIAGLRIDTYLTNTGYDPEINKYRVKCGQTIEEWEAAGWIAHEYDIRGWFQWYCRFFQGRRCDDDERQVGRWERCVGPKGRWRRVLLKKYLQLGVRSVTDEEGGGDEEDAAEVSPVVHQTCHHWAWEVRQDVLDAAWEGRL